MKPNSAAHFSIQAADVFSAAKYSSEVSLNRPPWEFVSVDVSCPSARNAFTASFMMVRFADSMSFKPLLVLIPLMSSILTIAEPPPVNPKPRTNFAVHEPVAMFPDQTLKCIRHGIVVGDAGVFQSFSLYQGHEPAAFIFNQLFDGIFQVRVAGFEEVGIEIVQRVRNDVIGLLDVEICAVDLCGSLRFESAVFA